MIAKDKRRDADHCHYSSLSFAETINNATSSTDHDGGTVVSSIFPVEVSFARAAVAAPLVGDTDQPGGGNGATSIISSSSSIYLSVLVGAALLATLLN